MSNVNPLCSNFLALPPALLFFSRMVTSTPEAAKVVAAANDEKPEPIMVVVGFNLVWAAILASYGIGPSETTVLILTLFLVAKVSLLKFMST